MEMIHISWKMHSTELKWHTYIVASGAQYVFSKEFVQNGFILFCLFLIFYSKQTQSYTYPQPRPRFISWRNLCNMELRGDYSENMEESHMLLKTTVLIVFSVELRTARELTVYAHCLVLIHIISFSSLSSVSLSLI
jgi:hypothetical protein